MCSFHSNASRDADSVKDAEQLIVIIEFGAESDAAFKDQHQTPRSWNKVGCEQ